MNNIYYLDYNEYLMYHNDDLRDYWFSNPVFMKSFYDEAFSILPTQVDNIRKVDFALQKLINMKLFDRILDKLKDCHYDLNKDKE